MTKLLFVCSQGRMRSRTAAACFRSTVTETQSCGLDKDALTPITQQIVDWCDVIICMENRHRNKISKKYNIDNKRLYVLGIPDEYGFMDDALIQLLKISMKRIGLRHDNQ